MIQLVAEDDQLVLADYEVRRIRLWLMALIPAAQCTVGSGPPVEIVIPDRDPRELTASLLRRIEEIAGCRFRSVNGTGTP
jgi:hypothetical protein